MKVLVAVDHSDATGKAIAFVGKLLAGNSATYELTLFHVVESLPEYLTSRSGGDAFRQVAEEWATHNQETGEALLASLEETLTKSGVAANRVHRKLAVKHALPEAKRVAAALSIIEEMKAGDYDVVVLGRRSSSPAALTFLGGVAEKVVREANGRTVWIVD